MGRYDDKTPNKGGKWIGLVLILLFTQPQLAIFLAVVGGIIWLITENLKKKGTRPASSGKSSTRYTTRQERFDECPQPFFCRHRDKAEHHVRRGKEIDPWDRPDIDISKYQRKQ